MPDSEWQTFLAAVNFKLLMNDVLHDVKVNQRSESEVMSRLIALRSIRKFIIDWLGKHYDCRDTKSVEKANVLKNLGNKEFQRRNYAASIPLYTKSAQYAIADSEELAIAIANRSAALYYVDKFQDCLKDIDLAIKIGYPRKLSHKLYMRSAQCYLKLKNKVMAEAAIKKFEEIVCSREDISEQKKDDIAKEVFLLKSFASKLENTAEDESTETKSCPMPCLAFGINENFPFASAALECKYTPEKGRHVIANRDVQKGQVLFVEKPFAFVLLDHDQPASVCSHCCRSYHSVSVPCKMCPSTLYCSLKCMNEAWSLYHKWECLGTQIGIGQKIGIAHLSLKVLLTGTTSEDRDRFNAVQRLVTNIDDISAEDLLVYAITAMMLTTYLELYTDFFGTVDLKKSLADKLTGNCVDFDCDLSTDNGKRLYVSSFLLRHTLQLICNGHAIIKLTLDANDEDRVLTESQQRIATGIFPSASMMNHSCDPNIINSFKNQYLIVKATKDIPAGSEVFNCYGPYFRRMSREERQESLKNQYRFTCACEPCTSPEFEYFLERFRALKCPNCNGPVLESGPILRCMDCGLLPSVNYAGELEEAQRLFNSAQTYISLQKDSEALDKLKQCLNMRRGLLYKHHDDIIDTLDLIGKVYAFSGKWLESISYLEHSVAGIEEKYGPDSIEVANELNKITDICLHYLRGETNTKTKQYKNALKKTRRLLDRAKRTMHLNYGPWNGGCQEIDRKTEQLSEILKNFNI